MTFVAKHRLIEEVTLEQEWIYLVNETLAGERCIVPLLEDLALDQRLPAALREVLKRQIEEETDHVARYEAAFDHYNIRGTGYERAFADFVAKMDSPTLKIFSLQALLESISLGALQYRLETFLRSPSTNDDQQILRDEEGHVRFGLAFLGDLRNIEGTLPNSSFNAVTKHANQIFARHFQGERISDFVQSNFGIRSIAANRIDSSDGMRTFRRISARNIVKIKSEFMGRYYNSERAVHG